ncbi:chromosome partitioning protein [Micromonosporaceae bacterium Da 78-11]
MVIEASVVAGYVIAWAVRKARRAGGRLDAEVDTVMDAGLDRLHDTVAAKLGVDPVLPEVEEEAAGPEGQVSELTRQRVELAVTAAARKDDVFGKAVTDLVAQLQAAEQRGGAQILAGGQSTVFTGDARAEARDGGFAFGQVGGDVNVDRGGERPDPS